MSLLQKLFKKRGIDKIEELSVEERETFDRYKLILDGREITVEKIEKFCRYQIERLEDRFSSGITPDDTYLKACLHVYLTLLKAIKAPEAERKALEAQLQALIDK